MPIDSVPIFCFLCAGRIEPVHEGPELVEMHYDGPDPLDPLGSRAVRFFAHEECMRRAASPAFRFPSHEDLKWSAEELGFREDEPLP